MFDPNFLLLGLEFIDELFSLTLYHEIVANIDDQRCIRDLNDSMLIMRGNFDSGMSPTGCRPTNQKGDFDVALLHFFGVVNHFIKRRRD